MADNDGQQALNWSPKAHDNLKSIEGQISNGLKNTNQKEIIDALVPVFHAIVDDMYGDASEDKYVKQVDLLSRQLKDLLYKNINDFVDIDLEELRTYLERNLELPDKKQFTAKELKKISEGITTSIEELLAEKAEDAKTELSEVFNAKLQSIVFPEPTIDTIPSPVPSSDDQNASDDKNIEQETQDIVSQSLTETYANALSQINSIVNNINNQIEKVIDIFDNVNKIINNTLNTALVNINKQSKNVLSAIQQLLKSKKDKEDVKNYQMFKKVSETVNAQIIPDKKTSKILAKIDNLKTTLIDQATQLKTKVKKQIDSIRESILQTIDKVASAIQKGVSRLSQQLITLIMSNWVVALILASTALVGVILRFIVPYLEPYLKKLEQFCSGTIDKIVQFFKKYVAQTIESVLDLILKVIGPPLRMILEAIVDILCIIIPPIAKVITTIIQTTLFIVNVVAKACEKTLVYMTPYAEKLGNFFVMLVMRVYDIATAVLEAIQPYAKIVGNFLLKIAVLHIDLLTLLVEKLKPIAEFLGQFFATTLLVVMKAINLIAPILKPIAFVLGAAIGELLFLIVPIVDSISVILDVLLVILDKLGPLIKIIFIPIKRIAYLAGAALSFFALVTVKFLSSMIKKMAENEEELREKARKSAWFIRVKLREFLSDIIAAGNYNKETAKAVANVDYLSANALDQLLNPNSDVNKIFDSFKWMLGYFKESWDRLYHSNILGPYYFLKEHVDQINLNGNNYDSQRRLESTNRRFEVIEQRYKDAVKKAFSLYDYVAKMLLRISDRSNEEVNSEMLTKLQISDSESDKLKEYFKTKFDYTNESYAEKNDAQKQHQHYSQLIQFLESLIGEHVQDENPEDPRYIMKPNITNIQYMLDACIKHNTDSVNSLINELKESKYPIIVKTSSTPRDNNLALAEVTNG